MAQWLGPDSAAQLGMWDADAMDARIAADAIANPATVAFDEATTILVNAGYVVAALSNEVYQAAKYAMMAYAQSLWLQTWRDNLNFVPSETGRDSERGNLNRRIEALQRQCIGHWGKINLSPPWAQTLVVSTEVIKA